MPKTVYVDFTSGSSGDGTSGTVGATPGPYSNIAYALAQETSYADALTIKCLGTSNTSWDHGAAIDITGHSFTSLVIEPDTGYEWTGDDPPLTIWNDNPNQEVFDVDMDNVTIRGFRIENRRSGSGELRAVYFGSGISDSSCIVENCKLYSNGNAVQSATGEATDYATVRNCLLANYSDSDTADAAYCGGNGNLRIHNCVIAAGGGQAVGASATGSKTPSQVINCLFLDYSDAVEDGITFGTISNNATSGTDPGDIGSTPVTGITTADFESAAIVDPYTGGDDFRLVTGSDLIAAGTPISGLTTDAFGNAYDASTPCIGYHEFSSGASVVPLAAYHYTKNTGSGL
jgi:hypothetical protein